MEWVPMGNTRTRTKIWVWVGLGLCLNSMGIFGSGNSEIFVKCTKNSENPNSSALINRQPLQDFIRKTFGGTGRDESNMV